MNHGGITMRPGSFRTGIRWFISRWSGDGRHSGMYDVWYSFRLGTAAVGCLIQRRMKSMIRRLQQV